MKNILFSIIVPAYQVENYIDACIESILEQKFEQYEVILVDDGSTDLTAKICDDYALRYEKIKVIHQKNSGLSEARNTGIREANGIYCLFVDSDDKLAANALANLSQVISDNNLPEVVINRRATLFDTTNQVIECRYKFDVDTLNALSITDVYRTVRRLPDCLLGAWVFVVKKAFIDTQSLFFVADILHEDEEWVPRVLLRCHTLAYNNNLLYVYRVNRSGSIMQVKNIKRLVDKTKIIESLINEKNNLIYSIDAKEMFAEIIRSILFGVICEIPLYCSQQQYEDVKRQVLKYSSLLKDSNNIFHRFCYLMLRVSNFEKTSNCMFLLNKFKEKLLN